MEQEDFYDVFASLALSAGTVVAVEASSFVSAVDAMPNFSVSSGAIIHEEDTTPADSSALALPGRPGAVVFPD